MGEHLLGPPVERLEGQGAIFFLVYFRRRTLPQKRALLGDLASKKGSAKNLDVRIWRMGQGMPLALSRIALARLDGLEVNIWSVHNKEEAVFSYISLP